MLFNICYYKRFPVRCQVIQIDFQNIEIRKIILFMLDNAFQLRYNVPCNGRAPLAQLVEHLTLNQGVPGSSP